MDGYHVEQNLFSKTDNKKDNFPLHKEKNEKSEHLISYSDPILISSSSLSAYHNEEENILDDNFSSLVGIEFLEDTLPEKKNEKGRKIFMKDDDRKDITKREKPSHQLIMLGLKLGIVSIILFICMFLFTVPAFFLLSLSLSIVGLIFSSIGWKRSEDISEIREKKIAIAGFMINLLFLMGVFVSFIYLYYK